MIDTSVEPEVFSWGSTDVLVGANLLEQLADITTARLAPFGVVGVFCGCGSMRAQGTLQRLEDVLGSVASLELFEGIESNPTLELADEGAAFLQKVRPDLLIAIGGGSVIDLAKVSNCAAQADLPAAKLLERGSATGRLAASFVAIPTTSGTGSEVTPFATIWDVEGGRKLSLDTHWNLPNLAVLDPVLTISMPPSVTRQTAADAIGHGLETLWSRRRSVLSDSLGLAALELLVSNVPVVRKQAWDLQARAEMQKGSLLAGMAISLTRTGAAHAFSYGLTLQHKVPHGFAVARFLPGVLRANLPMLADLVCGRLNDLFQSGGNGLVKALGDFLASEGLVVGGSANEFSRESITQLLETSRVPGRLDNNLAEFGEADIVAILEEAFHR